MAWRLRREERLARENGEFIVLPFRIAGQRAGDIAGAAPVFFVIAKTCARRESPEQDYGFFVHVRRRYVV
jgi:hypothetical protein